jgi:hypothetical protein
MTSNSTSPVRSSKTRNKVWWLVILLVLSEAVYLAVFRVSFVQDNSLAVRFLALMSVLFALYGIACLLSRNGFGRERNALFVIAAGALLFRVTLLGIGVNSSPEALGTPRGLRSDVQGESVVHGHLFLFDDDLWRYLWDGHVSAAGVNPYQYPPNDPSLDQLPDTTQGRRWSEIRSRVNHPDLPTVYPPLAQLVFRFAHWIAPGSILAFKSIVCLVDLIAALFIALTLRAMNCAMTGVVLYAWNPLVITMIAGSGHIDALAATAIAATIYFLVRKRPKIAGVTLALAVAGKLAPVVLLPLMIKRLRWRGTAIFLVALLGIYLPFSGAASVLRNLGVYVYQWQFNSGWFHTLNWLLSFVVSDPSYVARVMSGFIILAVTLWLALHNRQGILEQFLSSAATTLGVFLILNPTIMPWYVIWLLPLAVIARQQIWIYFSALVCLSVLMMVDWRPHPAVLAVEYGVLLILACWKWYKVRAGQNRLDLVQKQGQEFFGVVYER